MEDPKNDSPEMSDAGLSLEALVPRGPWSFWKEALPGGFDRWGLAFLFGWLVLQLSSGFWAQHMKFLAGNSSLPSYWGEQLTTRDVWELAENGGMASQRLGTILPLVLLATLIWILWTGWKLQSETVALPAALRPWLWGLLDALLLGLVPLWLGAGALTGVLAWLGDTGIQGLGWAHMVGCVLIRMALGSALMVHWWLCRLNRASHDHVGIGLGSFGNLARHLGHSFLRFWSHPVQWGLLVLGGVLLKAGLHLAVLLIAWRMGGSTAGRVWLFLGLQGAAALVNGWIIGWFMRLTALFWWHDAQIRTEIRNLELESESDREAGVEA
jgi:hypothetical protein